MHIQDAVVGHIEPTETELSLIEDPNMQRLRYVKQVGFANLVYPGANHTRFEHSLGTMKRTRELVERISGEPNEELECVGLLHDIGHSAFSHAADELYEKYLNTTHEKVGEGIIRNSSVADVIRDSSLSIKKVLSYFNGNNIGQVVTGSVGSDRLDYLIRDAHYTGVAFGLIDYQHIRNAFALYKGIPAIYESGITSVEYMLIARYSMFSSIYLHHTALIAEGMYMKAVTNAIESGEMEASELKSATDWSMTEKLLRIDQSKTLMKRLLERKLFKRAYNSTVPVGMKLDEVKAAIEKAGVRDDEYVAVLTEYKGRKDNISVVNKNGELSGKMTEVSPLIKTLSLVLSSTPRVVVACCKNDVEKVNAAMKKSFQTKKSNTNNYKAK